MAMFVAVKPSRHVTRFEVIDETGRVYVAWPCSIECSWQDNERTLKVFVTKATDDKK